MKSEARGEEVCRSGVVYNKRPYALEDGDMRGLGAMSFTASTLLLLTQRFNCRFRYE
jgi:hypothetical protein